MKLTKKQMQVINELKVQLAEVARQTQLLMDYYNTGVQSPELTQLLLQQQLQQQ